MQLEPRQRRLLACACLAVLAVWLANGLYLPALAASGRAVFWLVDFFQWIVLPGALVFWLARSARIRPADYGFRQPQWHWMKITGDTVGVFITSGLAFFVARNVVWLLLDQPRSSFSLGTVFPSGGLPGGLARLYASITAGVVESAFFIGIPWLLYQRPGARPSRALFTVLSSALFAAAHWEQGPHVVCGAFLSGVVSCFWFFQLRNMWPVAGGHALVDLVAFA